MKKAPWDYEITWHWRGDDHNKPDTAEVSATSAPRAVSKLKKQLQEEFGDDFSAAELVVMDVRNLHLTR